MTENKPTMKETYDLRIKTNDGVVHMARRFAGTKHKYITLCGRLLTDKKSDMFVPVKNTTATLLKVTQDITCKICTRLNERSKSTEKEKYVL